MLLININKILSVWTIDPGIFSILDIDNLSLYNIEKDTVVYMMYRKNVYIRYKRKYLCPYYTWKFCLYVRETKSCLNGI